MRHSRAGFTLIEVVVATALSSIVLMGFFQLLSMQGRVASEEVQETDAQTGVVRAMSNMLSLLQEARPVQDIAYKDNQKSNIFKFRVPFKTLDGVPTFRKNKSGNERLYRYGAGWPGSMIEGAYYEMEFQLGYEAGVGRLDERIEEAKIRNANGSVGVDLNADGDKTDVFTFGTMVLRERASNDALINERVLGGRICVEDGKPAIFNYTYPTLTVTLLYADIRNKDGEYSRLRKTESVITLRNNRPAEKHDPAFPLDSY